MLIEFTRGLSRGRVHVARSCLYITTNLLCAQQQSVMNTLTFTTTLKCHLAKMFLRTFCSLVALRVCIPLVASPLVHIIVCNVRDCEYCLYLDRAI